MSDHPEDISSHLLQSLPDGVTPLMLFGSYARGDNSPTSDIDVLELSTQSRRAYRVDCMNISVYSETTLREMSHSGSLFVLHLKVDGLILRDPGNKLKQVLDEYRRPTNYDRLRYSLRELAMLLDASEPAYNDHWMQYNQLLVFILRSTIYADFAEAGVPTFSLSVICADLADDELNEALKLKSAAVPQYSNFQRAQKAVRKYLKASTANPYGTTEALITNLTTSNPWILKFGLGLLGREAEGFGYDLPTPALAG